jgi:hypothetical protein
VSTNHTTLGVSSNQSWAAASLVSGNVNVTVAANPNVAERSAVVRVVAGSAVAEVRVVQAGGPPRLGLSVSSWSAGYGAVTGSLVVTTNSDVWQAVSDQSWLSVSPVSGRSGQVLYVPVTANPSTVARQGVVTVTSGGVSASLTVTQQGRPATVSLAATSWSVAGVGGSRSVVVTTNHTGWVAVPAQDWVSVTPGGVSGESLVLTVGVNPSTAARSTTVRVTAGSAYATFTVYQAGGTITTSR